MKYFVCYRTMKDWPDSPYHCAGPYSATDIHYQMQDIASYAGVYDVGIESQPDDTPPTYGVVELGQPVGEWVPIY